MQTQENNPNPKRPRPQRLNRYVRSQKHAHLAAECQEYMHLIDDAVARLHVLCAAVRIGRGITQEMERSEAFLKQFEYPALSETD